MDLYEKKSLGADIYLKSGSSEFNCGFIRALSVADMCHSSFVNIFSLTEYFSELSDAFLSSSFMSISPAVLLKCPVLHCLRLCLFKCCHA